MRGFVRARDLLLHAPLIIWEFGLGNYARCVRRAFRAHERPVTFLECISLDAMPERRWHTESCR
jgi:hypothetical protein